ncbi:hypothetical protein, variant [Aphanomyces astaci]|uniref:Transmembrane protein n=2 Tax=Aphanomyces astaci TaxID=112090 RepID=W4G965_APHAT|nr:hypothetical protein, variant [Aphanomyces astaci]ETV76215.1 hypothetical protein, variant [Aphanomyces astaci]|eukprot:XP_009834340.1 hypothetical protein, variant [Aphanomyces astaci]
MSQSPNSASADLRQRGGGSQSPDGVQTAQAGSSLLPTTLLDAISDQSTLRSRLSGSTALLSKLPSKLHVGDSIPYSSLSLNVSVDDLHTPTQSSSSTTGGFGTPSSSHMSMSLPELMSTITRPMERLAFEVKGALLATGLAATCYLLNWFKVVLVPFFLAIFLMYLVDPLVEMIDVSPRYFLCICTSRGRHSRRRSRGCSRAFASLCAVSVVCTFFGLLGYITVLSVHALDVGAYQKGYNALVASIENISKQVGLPMNITVTLHENVDKVATLVLTEMMDLFSTLFVTMIYLTYFLSTRVRASDAGTSYVYVVLFVQYDWKKIVSSFNIYHRKSKGFYVKINFYFLFFLVYFYNFVSNVHVLYEIDKPVKYDTYHSFRGVVSS